MPTRYTNETKRNVVQFVRDYDRMNGRGGKSAARRKFKINPITIAKWCNAAPVVKDDLTTDLDPKRVNILQNVLRFIRDNDALSAWECRELAANALSDAHPWTEAPNAP